MTTRSKRNAKTSGVEALVGQDDEITCIFSATHSTTCPARPMTIAGRNSASSTTAAT